MTEVTTKPLYKRLHDHDKFVSESLSQAFVNMTLEILAIQDPVIGYDLGQALEGVLSALGVPDNEPLLAAAPDQRSEYDTVTPLYQRIDAKEAPHIGQTLRRNMSGIQLLAILIKDEGLRGEYLDALKVLWEGFGLPTASARNANPDAFPGVGKSAVAKLADILGADQQDKAS